MSEPSVEVVREMFDRFRGGGIEDVLETLDKDVVVEIPPELSAEPDTYHGHDGVRRYFAGFAGMLDDVRYEALDLTPSGEDVVIAHIRLSGRGVSSGLDVDMEGFTVHEVANGKIVRIRPYADLESAQTAAG